MRVLEHKKTIDSSGVYDFVFQSQTKNVTIDVKENINVTLHLIFKEANNFNLKLKFKN